MKIDQRQRQIDSDRKPSAYFREYLRSISTSSNSVSSSSVSITSNEITSSSGSLYFNTSGIINFNGLRIDFSDTNEQGVLIANSSDYTSFQPLTWLGYVTGTLVPILADEAPTGWILAQEGTIGNNDSGATVRANDDTESLFIKLWQEYDQTQLTVSGGRGSSGNNDFAAGKTIELPSIDSMVVAASGDGSGLTSRENYNTTGSRTHTMTVSEMFEHIHPLFDRGQPFGATYYTDPLTYYGFDRFQNEVLRKDNSGTFTLEQQAEGGNPRSNVEKTIYINFMIKL